MFLNLIITGYMIWHLFDPINFKFIVIFKICKLLTITNLFFTGGPRAFYNQ